VQLDDELLEEAATLDAGFLRSLDAIHLAAARLFGDELSAVVTYDERMAAAAVRLHLPIVSPRDAG
jgi:predicted nucleic acid-binding protein